MNLKSPTPRPKSSPSVLETGVLPDSAIYVIDASAFVFRAYYALQPLSSKGRPSHAVMGFASMLLKLLSEKKPKSCVIVFDSKKPSFRKDLYAEYKAHREVPPPDLSDQIVAIMEMCKRAEFPVLQKEGFEADDLIASFVKRFRGQTPIVLVSSDKDLGQLVSERVVMYDSFRNRVLGPKEIEEKYLVPPHQIRDFLALTGDSSDNIPGISGVGPKTAAQWLKEFKGVKEILKHPEKLPEKMRTKVEASLEDLKISYELVKLDEDMAIPFDELPALHLPLPSGFSDFLNEWDCQRVIKAFDGMVESSGGNSSTIQTESRSTKAYQFRCVQSEKELEELQKLCLEKKLIAFDIETNLFNRWTCKIVGISICATPAEAWYIPYRHQGGLLSEAKVQAFLKFVLGNPKIEKIAHNLKYDFQVLSREGIRFDGALHDTMVMAHLLSADRRSFSLENLSRDLLGEQKGDLKGLLDGGEDFSTVPLDQATTYAAMDAHLTRSLFEQLYPQLQKSDALTWIYQKVEMPLVQVLASMESTGIRLNASRLKKLSVELHEKTDEFEKKIYKLAGHEFNIQSPKQLQKVLFEELKLPAKKKTQTGFSTDESVLEELSLQHDLPRLILDYRGLAKLTSTYVDTLPNLLGEDGRLHTSYHQTGTATGRLSSSDPNLQNIPVRSEEGIKIRSAFIADKGFELMSADYSQVELRLFASLSGEKNMIDAFENGRDIHSETAKIIFGNDEKEFRARAKAINFGIIYGISAHGLSRQIGSSRTEAQTFMEAYFKSFPRLKEYMSELVEVARKCGYTETLFGRRRPLPDIQSKNPTLRAMAERIAINAPVQGTAADIMKWAMVKIHENIQSQKLKSRILLQVHDELVLEVFGGEEDVLKSILKKHMVNLSGTPAAGLKVPLVIDFGQGSAWSEL